MSYVVFQTQTMLRKYLQKVRRKVDVLSKTTYTSIALVCSELWGDGRVYYAFISPFTTSNILFAKASNSLSPTAITDIEPNLSGKGNELDRNPNTYVSSPNYPAPSASTVYDLRQYDLGAVMDVVVVWKVVSSGVYRSSQIYVSTDGSTWTNVFSAAQGPYWGVWRGSARYVKWSLYLPAGYNGSSSLYEILFFPASMIENISSLTVKEVRGLVGDYYLLALISGTAEIYVGYVDYVAEERTEYEIT